MDLYIQIYDPDWYGILNINQKIDDEKKRIFITGGSTVYSINTVYLNEKLSENEFNINTSIGIPANCGNVIKLGSEPKYAASLGLLDWQNFIHNERNLLNGNSGPMGERMKGWIEGISNWSKGFF